MDKTPVTVPECRQRPDLAGPGSPQDLSPQRLDPCGVHSEEKTGPEKVLGGREEISHLWTCLDGGPCSGSGGLARPGAGSPRRGAGRDCPARAAPGIPAAPLPPASLQPLPPPQPPRPGCSPPPGEDGIRASGAESGGGRQAKQPTVFCFLTSAMLAGYGGARRAGTRAQPWGGGARTLGRRRRLPGSRGGRYKKAPQTRRTSLDRPPPPAPPAALLSAPSAPPAAPSPGCPPPPGRGPGPGPRLPGAAPLGPPRLEAGPCSRRRGQTRPARSRRSSPRLPVPTPSGCLSVPSPLTPAVRLSRKASCPWDLLETAKLVVRVLRGRRGPSSSSWAVITARANIFWFSLCAPLTFALSRLHPSPQASNPAFSREAVEAFRLSQDDIPSEGTEAQAQVGLHC